MLSTTVIFAAIFGIANSIPVPQDQQLNGLQQQFNPQLLINHLQLQQAQGLQQQQLQQLQPGLQQQLQLQPQLYQQQAFNLPASTQLAQPQGLFQQAPADQQFQQAPQQFPPSPAQPPRARPQPQAQLQQYIQQQITPANAQFRAIQQQQQAQQPQQSLLGVAYSSAGDVSKTQFNGYGIAYNF